MRKGVTPVVAVTLLITLTVGAAGTFYLQFENVQQQSQQQGEVFNIDRLDIEICRSGNPSTLHIRNSNTEAINASKLRIYINSQPVDNSDYRYTPEIVDPQRNFELEIDQRLRRNDTVKLIANNNEFTHRCLN